MFFQAGGGLQGSELFFTHFFPNKNASGGGFGGGFQGFHGSQEDLFEDLAGLFGQGGGRSRGKKGSGRDISVSVTISFMDALKGCTKVSLNSALIQP